MLHRTIYMPWGLGQGGYFTAQGPCALGVGVICNAQMDGSKTIFKTMADSIMENPLCVDSIETNLEVAMDTQNFLNGLRRLAGEHAGYNIFTANDAIRNPHTRALFAQWLFSGIPHPKDAHLPMSEAEMYFEVIMLAPNEAIPDCCAIESPVTGAIDVPFGCEVPA